MEPLRHLDRPDIGLVGLDAARRLRFPVLIGRPDWSAGCHRPRDGYVALLMACGVATGCGGTPVHPRGVVRGAAGAGGERRGLRPGLAGAVRAGRARAPPPGRSSTAQGISRRSGHGSAKISSRRCSAGCSRRSTFATGCSSVVGDRRPLADSPWAASRVGPRPAHRPRAGHATEASAPRIPRRSADRHRVSIRRTARGKGSSPDRTFRASGGWRCKAPPRSGAGRARTCVRRAPQWCSRGRVSRAVESLDRTSHRGRRKKKPGWSGAGLQASRLVRGADSNRRPSGYEPDELPLLHPAAAKAI